MNIGALIIARMSSSRFPGKVIAELFGEPMVGQIIKRMKTVVDTVCVATTSLPDDDELEYVARDYGALVYRGETWDVFHRRWNASIENNFDYAFDVSGDCPFIDVELCRLLYNAVADNPGYDYYTHPPYYRDIGEAISPIRGLTYYPRVWEKLEKLTTLEERKKVEGSYGALLVEKGFNDTDDHTYFIKEHLNRIQTPMKLSIDYPIELDVANLICEHLNHVPNTTDELVEAYKVVRIPSNLNSLATLVQRARR